MPDALEFPRMLRPVVPLMSCERLAGFGGGIVLELIALAFGHSIWPSGWLAGWCPWLCPSLAAVIGPLNDLPEPAAGLRREQAIWVRG